MQISNKASLTPFVCCYCPSVIIKHLHHHHHHHVSSVTQHLLIFAARSQISAAWFSRYCMKLQYVFRYIYAVDVIKKKKNAALILLDGTTVQHVPSLLWLHTCTSRSCSLYSGKSILGVSVVVTSGSHLFVKDLAAFKLLFPFCRPVLYTKLSCHWWHQMTSITVYSSRSSDGLQYTLEKEGCPLVSTTWSGCAAALWHLYKHFIIIIFTHDILIKPKRLVLSNVNFKDIFYPYWVAGLNVLIQTCCVNNYVALSIKNINLKFNSQ